MSAAPVHTKVSEAVVGLALSGGGFRAAAFHLGVLKRLEELGILRRVSALSTVSGGSIVGALYALRCSQRGGAAGAYPVDQLIAEMRPFLSDNLRARALFGTPARAVRTLWSLVSKRVSRIGLMVNELDRQLFGSATLNQLPPWIVINATNLRSGKGWKFYADRAGDFSVGATEHTSSIKVAEAVAASAAYPGLTDSYAFVTRWEHLRDDLLDENRWERPPQPRLGVVSRWRQRYGKTSGPAIFPLVDGGLYDNEGVNSLRGRRVTHAIISAVAPPDSDDLSGFSPLRYRRIVEVMHSRLGAATRQLAHEMTHRVHPSLAQSEAAALAEDLRAVADVPGLPDPATRLRLKELAARVEVLSAVGMPPRGHQFTASAQILLHRTDVAENVLSALPRGGYDIPPEFRGLDTSLVAELSRVRTDLDALEPAVIELLIAQGYFLTDFYVKLTMPDLALTNDGASWYSDALAPSWPAAHRAVALASANRAESERSLRLASSRRIILGHVANSRTRWRYRACATIAAGLGITLLVGTMWLGLWILQSAASLLL